MVAGKGAMRIYLDSNVYSFITVCNEAFRVRDALREAGHRIISSHALLVEAAHVSDPEVRLRRIRDVALLRTGATPVPLSHVRAREILDEIQWWHPRWLLARPDAQRAWVRAYLRTEEQAWAALSRDPDAAVRRLASSVLAEFVASDESVTGHILERQKARRDWSRARGDGTLGPLYHSAESDEAHRELGEAELFWRSQTGYLWAITLDRQGESGGGVDPFGAAFLDRSRIDPDAFERFWLWEVREERVPRSRIRHLANYYQTFAKITHGNRFDAEHACYLLDCDVFITADQAFFTILKKLNADVAGSGTPILINRAASSALEQIQQVLASFLPIAGTPALAPRSAVREAPKRRGAKLRRELDSLGPVVPHLVDAIRSNALRPPTWLGASSVGRDNCARVRAGVEDCPVYVIDDVAEYFYARTSQEYWEVARDFSDLRPPADVFWIETARPTSVSSEAIPGGQMESAGFPIRWGCLFSVLDLEPEPKTLEDPARCARLHDGAIERMQAITSMGGNPEQMLHAALAGAEGPVLTELRQIIGLIARLDRDMYALADSRGPVRHVLTARLITQYDRVSPIGPLMVWCLPIDNADRAVRPPDIGVPPPQAGVANAKVIVSKIADRSALIYPFLLALTRINQGAATVTERAPARDGCNSTGPGCGDAPTLSHSNAES